MKMKFLLAVFCIAAAPALWADSLSDETDEKKVDLKGTFVWSNKPEETHDLIAKLTPTGRKEWKAVWNFKWGNKPMTYIGSVKGDLLDGTVTGTGNTTAGPERTFIFDGTAKDGVIKIKHYETTKGKKSTGDGELHVVD